MCCHNRGRRARPDNYQPFVVYYGIKAYDKYKARKLRNLEAANMNGEQSRQFERKPRLEVSEKPGSAPPSYNDVIVNRAAVPEYSVNITEKGGDLRPAIVEDEAFRVADGFRAEMNNPMMGTPEMRYSRCGRQQTAYGSSCQQKRAERAAKKAEKKAAKAAEREMRKMRI